MSDRAYTLDDFASADPREFADSAYRAILGRPPSAAERERMVEALLAGSTRPFLLGSLRYGAEGRERRVDVRGLRVRYQLQRAFRVPLAGAVLEWASAVARLPRTARYIRGSVENSAMRQSLFLEQSAAERAALEHRLAAADARAAATLEARLAAVDARAAEGERRMADADRALAEITNKATMLERALADVVHQHAAHAAAFGSADAALASQVGAIAERTEATLWDVRAVRELAQRTHARVEAMHPPSLPDTMAVAGGPLAALARERAGLAPDVTISTLPADARYALFETVFYDSTTVAAKQKIYLEYVDRALAREAPFLDLGCGRGEFMRILREAGIESIGVDVNPAVLTPLQSEGFIVAERDLIAFLEDDLRMFCGASVLQVAEHLKPAEIERMLALIAPRLLAGAPLIVETPNPLSPFALGVFHTDPTHVSPIPPERMRYSIEAAGFERTLTLYQARIPEGQFAGPDPRAYYADYAIVAYRTGVRDGAA